MKSLFIFIACILLIIGSKLYAVEFSNINLIASTTFRIYAAKNFNQKFDIGSKIALSIYSEGKEFEIELIEKGILLRESLGDPSGYAYVFKYSSCGVVSLSTEEHNCFITIVIDDTGETIDAPSYSTLLEY